MALTSPTQLRQFLESIGAAPNKRLSQNFLIDGNIIRKTLDLAEVKPGDCVLEIGPGPGALTEALLARGAHVLAVEKDPTFAQALRRLQTEDGRLQVFCDDILLFPIQRHIQQKIKVVANLPYNITTPILTHLAPMHEHVALCTVMIQEEVARRFTAEPGGKTFGSITLFLQFYGMARYGFPVKRSCFYPAPNVDSAVIRYDLAAPPADPPAGLFPLIHQAYQQRRKMLRASLRTLFPSQDSLTQTLEGVGIAPTARPETLSLDDWICLAQKLPKKSFE